MAYVRGASRQPAGPVIAVEQVRRHNAELRIELHALATEKAGLDERIKTMRKDLSAAYIQLRRQIRDLDAVRAQQDYMDHAATVTSTLPPPKYGGREGLEAATLEMIQHENKHLKLSKPRPLRGPSHGTIRRYEGGCRCDECMSAWERTKARKKALRHRKAIEAKRKLAA